MKIKVDTMCAMTAMLALAAGCYAGARARRDVDAAWRGRSRAELEARWGKPRTMGSRPDGSVMRWFHSRQHVRLPSAHAELYIAPGVVRGSAALLPGAIWNTFTEAAAVVNGGGRITQVTGRTLEWGPPNDANMRWGTILGLDVGMGRLDSTSTPLPSGGLYIGGMLGPRFGLAGTFQLAAGHADAGGAMGLAGGMAAVWWPATRVSLRAGPALVLAFDPGFGGPSLGPGITAGAGYAVVKVGRFVLDLRADITAAPFATFGNVGIGVNLN